MGSPSNIGACQAPRIGGIVIRDQPPGRGQAGGRRSVAGGSPSAAGVGGPERSGRRAGASRLHGPIEGGGAAVLDGLRPRVVLQG